MYLEQKIQVLNKVGPKTSEKLKKIGLETLLDLLLFFPRDYQNIFIGESLDNFKVGDLVSIKGDLVSISKPLRLQGKVIITMTFKNDVGLYAAKFFNMPYIVNSYKEGENYNLTGKVSSFKGKNILINPSKKEIIYKEIIPLYSLTKGISNDLIINLERELLSSITIKDSIPEELILKNHLISLDRAIKGAHFPENKEELKLSLNRLIYQEFLTYSIKILLTRKYLKDKENGISFNISKELVKLKESIPYELTKAQRRVIREILNDEKSPSPMNRLVQGDVGSGKTIVALIGLFNVIKNGYQGAFMAPTEILANQHFIEGKKVLSSFNIKIELLTGSLSLKSKNDIKERVKNGEVDLVIGTHALLTSDVIFKNLGLVITDEQHRFGVLDRNKLINKGKDIDVLVMTATPIPRTLSLCMFGDLDVSLIDEMPPGRKIIDTYFTHNNNRDKVYNFAKEEIKKGRQVYVVCPLVLENENYSSISLEEVELIIKNKYNIKKYRVLYGSMKGKEKDEIMDLFNKGDIDMLISTTVIEVGINVKNATVIIIEGAERFGLSQLHQLRGRVGRGEEKSYCIMLGDIKNPKVERRLQIIKENNDGFAIAEEDLKIRGSGEIFGVNQSGDEGFILGDPYEDMEIFKIAHEDGKEILESKKEENIRFIEEIEKKIEKSSKFICFN